jgi:hypothetical protein
MQAREGCHARRDPWLANALDAGAAVVVRRSLLELALWERDRPPRPVRLPFDRSVRFVQVSSDDRITPAGDLDPHSDGPVAEGADCCDLRCAPYGVPCQCYG